MDIQTGLICVGLVILSVAILLFISLFDMHKKTYEEAIAEQRKLPKDALLLGRLTRDKNKDKKQKRQGKKVKEKHSKPVSSKESLKSVKAQSVKGTKKDSNKDNKKDNGKTPVLQKDTNKEVKREVNKDVSKDVKKENVKNSVKETKKEVHQPSKDHSHTHVNFISPEAEIIKKTSPVEDDKQKKKKKKNKGDEIKPILVNKEEPVIVNNKASEHQMPANHFTKIVPKDELRLKLSSKADVNINNSDSENVQPNQVNEKEKEKKGKSKKENNKNNNEKQQKSDVKPLNNANNKNTANNNNKMNKNDKAKIESTQKIETKENIPVKTPVVENVQQQKKAVNQNMNTKETKEQKNKKNKKNELAALQQLISAERDSINIQHLIPMIRKADLSRSEVQLLTDVLLNKHTDNEVANHSEWIEGRQDPVVKLKKQLAEKEKALTEEQEASQAFQNKLKELRSEYNAERARLSQACRQYEETIIAKQNELSNLHARNRHVHESHVSEKQALTQKLQQLQAQINDDNMVIRKLQEENSQTHNAFQELVNQRQQMEMHVARVKEQHEESENSLKTKIHAQIHELEKLTASFNAELQKNMRIEAELNDLREQHIQNQNKIKTLESRASQLKESSSHSQELSRQIEDLQRSNKEMEKRLNGSLKMEEELKFEKIRLQNDVHAYTNKISELQNEFDKVLKEKEKLAAQLLAKMEMEKELIRFKEENQNLISQVATFTKIEKEAQQLREENENLAAQMTAFTERPAADGRENGDSMYNEDQKKNINIDFINHENESRNKNILTEKLEAQLHQNKILLDSLNNELTDCKSEITKLNTELLKYKTEVGRLHEELEQQRNKNNEIHRRSWKAVEALDITEKSLANEQKRTEKLTEETLLLTKQRDLSKETLLRIFPDVNIDEDEDYDKWLRKFEETAKVHLAQLSSSAEVASQPAETVSSEAVKDLESKNGQLQSLVTHYKTIIDETEGMLCYLQSHIEQEEIRWNKKLEMKDVEITTLKKDHDALSEKINSQLNPQIDELEKQLSSAREELDRYSKTVVDLQALISSDKENNKKLVEERDSLNSKLTAELEKMKELNMEIAKLKSTVKIGQASFKEEQNKRLQLEEEFMRLTSQHNGESPVSTTAGVSAANEKPKSRKPKWPVSGWFFGKLGKKRKLSNHRRKSH